MHNRVQTDRFSFEYIESHIESTLLWESHCHAQFEMIAVLEGDVSIALEGRTYRLTANQTAIIPPLYYHTVSTNKKGMYRRVTVLFDFSAIPEVLQKEFSTIRAEIPIFTSYSIGDLRKICKSTRPHFYVPLAESLMVQAMYDSIRAEHADSGEQIDETLQAMLTYIDEHLCEKITLDALATHTARSKSSVCHLFQEKMKISPKQYILQKKLALADKLIRNGTPLTVAAIEVGYENYSNFYRMYRKHLLYAPTNE